MVREEVRLVVSLLNDLRRPDAEILRLAAWEGLDIKEIAVVLDLSPAVASQRLSRARKRLTVLYDKQQRNFVPTSPAKEGGIW